MSPLRLPKPRSLLHLIPLRTATEFIALTLALNNATGLYGLLALFTGYALNPLQLSHYLYCLLVLGLVIWLSGAIRAQPEDKRAVIKVLALAWVYVGDAVINSVYTLLFGLGWFVLLAQHLDEPMSDAGAGGAEKMMNETAGFTDPVYPSAGRVDVVTSPSHSIAGGQKATAYATSSGDMGSALLERGSVASIAVLGLLWVVRVYFCLIVMAYARSMLRRHIAVTSNESYSSSSEDATMAENPFHGAADWRSKLGRAMLMLPSSRYWLGRDGSGDGNEWTKGTSGRFEAGRGLKVKVPALDGVSERERRARSGTGPPLLGGEKQG